MFTITISRKLEHVDMMYIVHEQEMYLGQEQETHPGQQRKIYPGQIIMQKEKTYITASKS